ncbi:hypothetical protein MSAN_01582100 [Mycena sanguinolenta]|uniref:Uncharacterized protein n=1 Tax=Mycena sanguinolenta TaxID=230812 RepID=A0A8H6Y011_9AGAR|nr:hypothetical protein MSAN_01582100 [Mycena sanguinolenta]
MSSHSKGDVNLCDTEQDWSLLDALSQLIWQSRRASFRYVSSPPTALLSGSPLLALQVHRREALAYQHRGLEQARRRCLGAPPHLTPLIRGLCYMPSTLTSSYFWLLGAREREREYRHSRCLVSFFRSETTRFALHVLQSIAQVDPSVRSRSSRGPCFPLCTPLKEPQLSVDSM